MDQGNRRRLRYREYNGSQYLADLYVRGLSAFIGQINRISREGCGNRRTAANHHRKLLVYLQHSAAKDYIINDQNLLTLPTLMTFYSIALSKPAVCGLVILREISISGTMMRVKKLANTLQVCLDSGAKRVLLPITSAADLGTVPSDLIGAFNIILYQSSEDVVFKALGVE